VTVFAVQVKVELPLAGTVFNVPTVWAKVDVALIPAMWTLHPVTATLEVPVFLRTMVHTSVVPTHVVTCPLTCAELVNDPNRPKTNPAIAMAAIRVMAIRITVARTGEIAFLFFVILKVIHSGLGPNT